MPPFWFLSIALFRYDCWHMLPVELKEKIDQLVEGISLRVLQREASVLSATYRQGEGNQIDVLRSDEQRLAYVLMRMPATYGVVKHVVGELFSRDPSLHVERVLDVGSGPGTSWWAMEDFRTPLQKWTCVERDPGFIRLAKQLCGEMRYLSELQKEERYDLVIASFSLGEMDVKERESVITSLWEMTDQALIIVEPGTPKSFERMRKIREQLLTLGAQLVAPCPGSGICPMQGGDWCHFAKRVERTSFHRQLKGGSLNYEDEKFTYLIFSRKKIPSARMRILSHPEKRSGHIRLKLCDSDQVVEQIVGRSSKEKYRQAKKKGWGDEWE